MAQLFDYTHKNIVITGGGSGIGQAMAIRFARHGGHVFIVELNEAGGRETAERICAEGGKATVIPCNVASHSETRDAVQSILSQADRKSTRLNSSHVKISY